ncbi:Double-stranded RNA-binding domain [Dillenia turbinata]|uniref:Double-stranded RNA-binding domain n=1 Tax=Dillenia turbinata TaxID=194707 RepID=A0AAN8VI30_9MAGN
MYLTETCEIETLRHAPYFFDVEMATAPAATIATTVTTTITSSDMFSVVRKVQKLLNYEFKNITLLKQALTHSSYTDAVSYQRLEFIGDAVLNLALANYAYLAYPGLDPGDLSLIRAANVSTEKLARIAVKHNLYECLRRNCSSMDDKVNFNNFSCVKEFELLVQEELQDGQDDSLYGGLIKAPKVLADIVESVAAAVFKGILEPIVMLDDLVRQPQPVTMLFEFCQKQGKIVDIKHWRKGDRNIASVYVDGEFVVSKGSDRKEAAKLNAAKAALKMVAPSNFKNTVNEEVYYVTDGTDEVEAAKQKLNELCGKRKWPKPIYR